jgi:hypothetical protein
MKEAIAITKPRWCEVGIINRGAPLSELRDILRFNLRVPPDAIDGLLYKLAVGGACGVGHFTYEVAETKVKEIRRIAEREQLDLKCILIKKHL